MNSEERCQMGIHGNVLRKNSLSLAAKFYGFATTHRGVLGGLCSLALIYALALVALAPVGLNFDSYHYFQMGVKPTLNEFHPIFFGIWLRLLSRIANVMGPRSFGGVYLFFNSGALALVLYSSGCFSFPACDTRGIKSKLGLGFAVVLTVVWLPAVFFILNTISSELLTFGMLSLIAILISGSGKSNLLKWGLLVATSVAAYQTRYQLIIIPMCFILMGLISFSGKAAFRHARYLMMGASLALMLFFSDSFLAMALPKGTPISPVHWGGGMVSHSIQCTLRCHITLFERDCSNPTDRNFIETATCSDMFLGPNALTTATVGPRFHDYLRLLGPAKFGLWLLKAPLVYLSDTHPIDGWSVKYADRNNRVSQLYPEGTQFFERYFAKAELTNPNPLYWRLFSFLDRLVSYRIYYWAAGLIVVTSCFLVFASPDASVQFLSWTALLTFLVFAYVAPHTPIRYLIQIMTPGLAALWRYLLSPSQTKNDSGI